MATPGKSAQGIFDGSAARAQRFWKHFARRRTAALEGLHLPTEFELLAGMPFLAGDLQTDLHAFAERLLPRLRRRAETISIAALIEVLEQLTIGAAGVEEVRAVAEAMQVASGDLPAGGRAWRLRCRIYLAHLGDPQAALDLARDAVTLAIRFESSPDWKEAPVEMIRVALGWLAVATVANNYVFLGEGDRLRPTSNPASIASQRGTALVAHIEQQALLESAVREATAEARNQGQAAPEPERPPSTPSLTAIVFREVGNATTGEGKKVKQEFQDLIDRPLPLVPMPDLAAARAVLLAEFPYAEEVIDRILLEVPARASIQLRPTILVGAPGSGKSRFARRLLTALGLPHDVVPCGGVSDGVFAGTARRWSTGEPSLPVALITRHKVAGPGAVLDEIEKVGTSRHNGQVHDAMLAFLERETACRYHDPYVQAPCDISHITWLMTANELEGVSAPLRDRCRVLRFPGPGHEHLPVLVRQIMTDILAEQGLDERWMSPLDEIEMNALAEAWPGGSLRVLRRMIEVVLTSRSMKH
ncbi:AAA family ATPase [Microvirga massiliensis]|uniref:AAA family ATPase n=1 Tax=Microvirga massiliensis TaxID=1033741 RepID=UPI0006604102|nr:AAA family ATPase [Microvirga massiliensis]